MCNGLFTYRKNCNLLVNYVQQHIKTSLSIIQNYQGEAPLAIHLKHFFSQHKKYGSKDRKNILQLTYCYYRVCNLFHKQATATHIEQALWLCSKEPNALLKAVNQDWNEQATVSFTDKLTQISISTNSMLFPWSTTISKGIDLQAWQESFLQQPNLFIRIRANYHQKVIGILRTNQIAFTQIHSNCIALPNNTNTEDLFKINKEVVIQDYASQQIGAFFESILTHDKAKNNGVPSHFSIWDCCAASGGKSILAKDSFPSCTITVSDVRPSILANLAKRFQQAGIYDYHSFVADLASQQQLHPTQYNLIICDVPCSGSGTWSRTPENLFFFQIEKLTHFTHLQFTIAKKSIQKLLPGGYFLYITCSIFADENEQIVDKIRIAYPKLQVLEQRLICGYPYQADSMFAALLHYPS